MPNLFGKQMINNQRLKQLSNKELEFLDNLLSGIKTDAKKFLRSKDGRNFKELIDQQKEKQ
jgi:uncharacterized protein YllA (UPF0747 family)